LVRHIPVRVGGVGRLVTPVARRRRAELTATGAPQAIDGRSNLVDVEVELGRRELAAAYSLRPEPFFLGIAFAAIGLVLSALFVRETHAHAHHEAQNSATPVHAAALSQRAIFLHTSFSDRNLSSISQAGLVNNLDDGVAWGLFPVFYAAAGLSLERIAWLAAIYPAVSGTGQLFTGALSDGIGRKWLIAGGMWVQAVGIALILLPAELWGSASRALSPRTKRSSSRCS
jgi:hypothetical protein